jgi:dTDP-glucose 4,6-dehydratase/UDP-glucose 4-epimerase
MRVKDARQTFLGIWIRQLIEGTPIKVFGDGKQLRDFNFVDDCVDALLIAGSSEATVGKAYNLGSEEVVSLRHLAELLVAMVPSSGFEIVPFPPERKAIDIGDYYSDFSLFRKETGWVPKVRLAEGLARTIDYYRAERGHYWGSPE